MSKREERGHSGFTVDPSPGASDESLVAAFKLDPEGAAGRRAASLLLSRYRKQVLAWCGRYVRDREGALDLAQEVLLNAFRNLAGYREQEKFSAWLFIITRNRCLGELRRRKLPLAEDGILDFLAAPGPGPDTVLEEKIADEDLRRLVDTVLTVQERDALWMRCFEALPVDVITRQLDITGATGARAVLQKARRKLRRALEERNQQGRQGEP